jgi:hypothetical protein
LERSHKNAQRQNKSFLLALPFSLQTYLNALQVESALFHEVFPVRCKVLPLHCNVGLEESVKIE